MSAMQWLKRFFMTTDMPSQKRTEYVMPCPFDPDKDRMVIIYDGRLTSQQRDCIKYSLQEFMGGDRRLLVLDDGPRVIFTSTMPATTTDAPMTERQRQAIQEYWDKFGSHANKYPHSQANDYLG